MGGNLTIRLLVAPPSKGIVIKGAGVLANPMAQHIEDQPRRREEAIGPVERFVRSNFGRVTWYRAVSVRSPISHERTRRKTTPDVNLSVRDKALLPFIMHIPLFGWITGKLEITSRRGWSPDLYGAVWRHDWSHAL